MIACGAVILCLLLALLIIKLSPQKAPASELPQSTDSPDASESDRIASETEEKVRLVKYYQEDLGAGCAVEVGALVLATVDGDVTRYEEVLSTWSMAVETVLHTWNPFVTDVTITGENNDKLCLQTRGSCVYPVLDTVSEKLHAQLVYVGFSTNAVTGGNYYKTATISATIS